MVLLEAAAQVFAREGTEATTNRIADRAGVSIGTLYQYFPDKYALLHAVAIEHVRDLTARLDRVFVELRRSEPPLPETMRAVLDVLVDTHRDRPALHVLMHRLAHPSPAELTELRAFEDRLADEVAFHLQRCGHEGNDAAAKARTVVHGIDAHLHRVLLHDEATTEALVELVWRLIGQLPDRR